jgi:hypothetical protein
VTILTINLVLSTLVFWIAARIYVVPRLAELSPRTILLPILLLHAFRQLGLMFLAPGATYGGIPSAFAYPAAFGDLVAAVLALAAIPAVASGARSAGSSYGSSMSGERWTCCWRSLSQRPTTRLRTWGRPTGSRRSGCRPSW